MPSYVSFTSPANHRGGPSLRSMAIRGLLNGEACLFSTNGPLSVFRPFTLPYLLSQKLLLSFPSNDEHHDSQQS